MGSLHPCGDLKILVGHVSAPKGILGNQTTANVFQDFFSVFVNRSYCRWAGYATSVLASLQIQLLSFIYSRVVRRLNDFENYRTETAYENNLIFKTFLFQV